MFAVVVFFDIKAAHAAEFSQAIAANAKASVDNEPGCRQFDVCRDPTEGNAFFLYEIYEDPAAFEAHKASEHFKAFDALTADWVASKRVLTYDMVGANPTR